MFLIFQDGDYENDIPSIVRGIYTCSEEEAVATAQEMVNIAGFHRWKRAFEDYGTTCECEQQKRKEHMFHHLRWVPWLHILELEPDTDLNVDVNNITFLPGHFIGCELCTSPEAVSHANYATYKETIEEFIQQGRE